MKKIKINVCSKTFLILWLVRRMSYQVSRLTIGWAKYEVILFFISCVHATYFRFGSVLGPLHIEAGDSGEVRYLAYRSKELFVLHATPGTLGKVQNAIVRYLSVHINKELTFVFFLCSDEAALVYNSYDNALSRPRHDTRQKCELREISATCH